MTLSTEEVRLTDVAEVNPRASLDDVPLGETVAFVPMAAMSAEHGVVTATEHRSVADVRKGFTPFNDGDVLIAKITPCFENGKIGQARIPTAIGFGSTEFHVVRPHASRLDGRYLHHFLRQDRVRLEGERRMTGSAGQRRVPAAFVSNLPLRLPPLAEQRRLADILDKADALRALRRATLAELDTLTQSIFLDLFGDAASAGQRWPTVRLGAHTAKIGSGATPSGGGSAYKDSGISLIRSMNVRDGAFTRKNLAFIDEQQAARLSNVQVEEGDVLLNITGASVARVCRAPKDVLPARVNQHVSIIRPDQTINSVFLEHLLFSRSMKRRLLKIGGAGATREAITKAQIKDLLVMCPPINIQCDFARRIAAVETLKSRQRAALAELDALFASLQHRAFRGEL